jgi:hypothetical protein
MAIVEKYINLVLGEITITDKRTQYLRFYTTYDVHSTVNCPHLHYEIHQNNVYLNPAKILVYAPPSAYW